MATTVEETTKVQQITAEILLDMPYDGFHYELVKGVLKQMSPAGHKHGRIAAKLTASLVSYMTDHSMGIVYAAETGFLISSNPDTVLAPDVAFVCQERVDAVGDVEGYWPGAPDLAVEVISPYDRYTEVEAKVSLWLEAGTRMIIVVNPSKKTVKVYHAIDRVQTLTEQDEINGGHVVPGWHMPVKSLFL